MRSIRRPRLRPRTSLATLGIIVIVALVIDVVGATAAYLVHHDDPFPLPTFALADAPRSVDHPALLVPQELATVDQVTARASRFRPDVEAGAAELSLVAARSARRYVETQDPAALERASTALDQLAATQVDGVVAHRYPTVDPLGQRMPDVWYSAETQGLALSAASLLARETGSAKWRNLAGKFFRGLLHFRDFARFGRPSPTDPWLSMVDKRGYLWFEEFPSQGFATLSMTAHLTALFGVYDYWSLSHKALAQTIFRGGVATVRHYLPELRVPGGVSRTGIVVGIRDIVHHRLLIRQLAVLSEVTGNRAYARWVPRLEHDVAEPSLPDLNVEGGLPLETIDPYSPMPAAYGFHTDPAVLRGAIEGTLSPDSRTSPDARAEYALAALAAFERDHNRVWLTRAHIAIQPVLDNSVEGLYRHDFEAQGLDGPISAPWYSAYTQGLMLEVFVRLSRLTHQPQWRQLAEDTFTTLLRFRADSPAEFAAMARWTSVVDDDGFVWFEQFPSGRVPSLYINPHMSTALAVYDYWRLTGSASAARLFAGAVTTVKHYLPRIMAPDGVLSSPLASGRLGLHGRRLLVEQMSTLARITHDQALAAASRVASAS
jgi:hypothetical protein